jgi:membrane-associated PAP2 superfamily phosphatase
MSDDITNLLSGPVGTAVRVAAAVLLVAAALWALTGVQFVSDDSRRVGAVARTLWFVVIAVVLVPLVVSPVGALEAIIDWINSVAGRD